MSDIKLTNALENEIVLKIKKTFVNRVLFIGVLGSHARKEPSPNSEIDIILILDKLQTDDVLKFKDFILSNNFNPLISGLIFGKDEFENWPKTKLFCLLYETRSLFGDLSFYVSKPNEKEIKQAIKLQIASVYYKLTKSLMQCSQTMELKRKVMDLYKQTFFILQMKYFLEENAYIPTKHELMEKLKGLDKIILNNCINKEDIITKSKQELLSLCEVLISWASNIISDKNIEPMHFNSTNIDKGKALTYERVKEILGIE